MVVGVRAFIVFALFELIAVVAAINQHGHPVKHIVVLMMENRSFDHLLGWLKKSLMPSIDGLTGSESLPRDVNDPSKGNVPVNAHGYDVSPDDPRHLFDDIAVEMNNDKMDGFVYESIIHGLNETNPVSMFTPDTAPIINTLAQEFAVFDRWFCSAPTCTDPNRAFALSGTSQGIINNYNGTTYKQMSYFEYLRLHNRTFKGYFQDDYWVMGYFEDMLKPEVSRYITDLEPNFYNDVANGDLAQFTWLQPRSSVHEDKLPTWQHPDASVQLGEQLIKSVYEALRAGPKWEETLFLITYDEHGGFYDHVTPPHGVPAPDDWVAPNGFTFNQLGVRIPTIAVSPWIPKGTIVHGGLEGEMPTPSSEFDATSILATSNILLGLTAEGAEPLSKRMAWANTFAGLLSLKVPRRDCPTTLPELPTEVHPMARYEVQSQKPINEHLHGQLILLCTNNYPTETAAGMCPGLFADVTRNQGAASAWLAKEYKVFFSKLRAAEANQDAAIAAASAVSK